MRALLAGLTRQRCTDLFRIAVCLLRDGSDRLALCAQFLSIEEICRCNYIDHGASIHSKGLSAGPLLRSLYSHTAQASENRAQRRFQRSRGGADKAAAEALAWTLGTALGLKYVAARA